MGERLSLLSSSFPSPYMDVAKHGTVRQGKELCTYIFSVFGQEKTGEELMSFWVAGVSRHRFLHALFTSGFRSLHITGNASKHITVKADSFETPVITTEASRSCSGWQRSASLWESKRNKNATKTESSNLCDWCFYCVF